MTTAADRAILHLFERFQARVRPMMSTRKGMEREPVQRETVEVHARTRADLKPCGHPRHVGTCAVCQRVQLARWREQLAQVG